MSHFTLSRESSRSIEQYGTALNRVETDTVCPLDPLSGVVASIELAMNRHGFLIIHDDVDIIVQGESHAGPVYVGVSVICTEEELSDMQTMAEHYLAPLRMGRADRSKCGIHIEWSRF